MHAITSVDGDGTTPVPPTTDQIVGWASALGFDFVGIASADEIAGADGLKDWLAAGYHGEMDYMERHASLRTNPDALMPGTVSAVMVGMNYAPRSPDWVIREWDRLADASQAVVSVYARGRDYHKRVRRQLQRLADQMTSAVGPFGYRAFCDSAPVMEVSLAQMAGLGWRGKHTLLLNRHGGSMFFLGALYTNLPLQPTPPVDDHCGTCQRCIDVCPTQAIVAPYKLDARRCISYLTIELPGTIEPSLRPLIGNRIYGCDDCQLICPWNKFAQREQPGDFDPRHNLDSAGLLDLFEWTAAQFDRNTQGSAIRRIGYERWSRNLAIAIGNMANTENKGNSDDSVDPLQRERALGLLRARRQAAGEMLAEHIDWAIDRLVAA